LKVGDVVARKDMPQFQFRIIGENETFPNMWNVELVLDLSFRKLKKDRDKKQMIAKDDERWFVVSSTKRKAKSQL